MLLIYSEALHAVQIKGTWDSPTGQQKFQVNTHILKYLVEFQGVLGRQALVLSLGVNIYQKKNSFQHYNAFKSKHLNFSTSLTRLSVMAHLCLLVLVTKEMQHKRKPVF